MANQQDIDSFQEFNEQFVAEVKRRIQQSPELLKYALVQTPEICLAAVEENGLALQYVDKPTADICNAAVKQTAEAMKFVPDEFLAGAREFIVTSEDRERQAPKSDEKYLALVRKDGLELRDIPKADRTLEVCKAAIEQVGVVYTRIEDEGGYDYELSHPLLDTMNQTPELCMAAVQRCGLLLKDVKEQTPEICLAAVQYEPDKFTPDKFITRKISREEFEDGALAYEGFEPNAFKPVLCYVKEQTPEICLEAVKHDERSMKYVKPELLDQVRAALEKVQEAPKSDENVPEAASGNEDYAMEDPRDKYYNALTDSSFVQTPEFCREAVDVFPPFLKYVKEQTPELCMAAVQRVGWTLEYVKEQTPEICLAAVKQDGRALEYVKEQTPEICMEAVRQDGLAVEYVKEQTPEICFAAVKQDRDAKGLVEDYLLDKVEAAFASENKPKHSGPRM